MRSLLFFTFHCFAHLLNRNSTLSKSIGLVYITDNTYEKHEVVSYEYELLKVLDFNVSVVTEKNFLKRYLLAAVAGFTDEALIHKTVCLSHFLVERSIQVYDFLRFPPSIIACSSICIALHTLQMDPWTQTLEYYTAISQSNPLFLSCTDSMLSLFRFSWKAQGNKELQSVNQKYHDLFEDLGISPPRQFPSQINNLNIELLFRESSKQIPSPPIFSQVHGAISLIFGGYARSLSK